MFPEGVRNVERTREATTVKRRHPPPDPSAPSLDASARVEASRRRLRRVFLEGFVALDVAEPLVSFDAERPAAEVRAFLDAHDFDRAGVRRHGLVAGYVERIPLSGGRCGDHLVPFVEDDLVPYTAPLLEAIQSLGVNRRCFVTVLGRPAAIVTLQDLEKPPVRMFLFGMITLLEMLLARTVDEAFPAEAFRPLLAPGRLARAEALRQERRRRGVESRLVDCLQFADKGQLALRIPGIADRVDPGMSRKAALRALKELESLRNDLAHGQEFVAEAFERILIFTGRLDRLLESL